MVHMVNNVHMLIDCLPCVHVMGSDLKAIRQRKIRKHYNIMSHVKGLHSH